MKTLRNIHEGFFSNVGVIGALYKNKIKEYFENINKNRDTFVNLYIPQYTIEEALKEINEVPDDWFNNGLGGALAKRGLDSTQVRHLKNFFMRYLIITPDVFDPKITTLPTWFKLDDDFFSSYRNTYSVDR